jgi:hypothetical protein
LLETKFYGLEQLTEKVLLHDKSKKKKKKFLLKCRNINWVGQMHPDEGTRSNAKMHYHKK